MSAQSLEHRFATMTVADLATFARCRVGDLVDHALDLQRAESVTGTPKRKKIVSKAIVRAEKAVSKKVGNTYNTRTEEGRDELNMAIATYLDKVKATEDKPAKATEIREAVGGTSAQIRTALNRMIGLGIVAYAGKAAGTRYWRA